MSAPTPAAVRCVVNWPESYNKADYDALMADPRREWQLLRDHIRAVVQEMRGLAGKHEEDGWYTSAQSLRTFADKLEGKA